MCSRQLSQKELKLKDEFGKCGLEEMCITTATLSTSNTLFLVNKPALYKIKNTNSYLLFGDPVDYTTVLKQLQESSKDPETLKRMMEGESKVEEAEINGEANAKNDVEEISKKVEDVKIDSFEFKEDDITLIMSESNISREEAIKALSNANNDVIQALVNLNKQ
ncbi:uncharacterized protein VICG_01379 [Vittaforma corneae ATCC 50505]|uniref:Uncharacterized protein n=1 Tax=Vittaforma corneae (strain ATCC 50505) TaxID=993615 RepID=L2GLB7_VITCO|nr:uncharacterized protein VICG_01379 [Vittaforma corneae ATCC 50505]ELA41631.1 hypothetical protein VICG_01379 [Vittaforma corneae ATCC 50505]